MTDTASLIRFALTGSPPLAPVSPLSIEQQRFLWLHDRHFVTVWHWRMQGAQLRAFTERGVTATISKDDVNELVAEGLMKWGLGVSVELTDMGREIAK